MTSKMMIVIYVLPFLTMTLFNNKMAAAAEHQQELELGQNQNVDKFQAQHSQTLELEMGEIREPRGDGDDMENFARAKGKSCTKHGCESGEVCRKQCRGKCVRDKEDTTGGDNGIGGGGIGAGGMTGEFEQCPMGGICVNGNHCCKNFSNDIEYCCDKYHRCDGRGGCYSV